MQDSVQHGFCSQMQFDHAPTKTANQSFRLERFPQLLDLSVILKALPVAAIVSPAG
jgi:Tfp pilus assembly pilus retraction ATPase PilT